MKKIQSNNARLITLLLAFSLGLIVYGTWRARTSAASVSANSALPVQQLTCNLACPASGSGPMTQIEWTGGITTFTGEAFPGNPPRTFTFRLGYTSYLGPVAIADGPRKFYRFDVGAGGAENLVWCYSYTGVTHSAGFTDAFPPATNLTIELDVDNFDSRTLLGITYYANSTNGYEQRIYYGNTSGITLPQSPSLPDQTMLDPTKWGSIQYLLSWPYGRNGVSSIGGIPTTAKGVFTTNTCPTATAVYRVKPNGIASGPCGDSWANACDFQHALRDLTTDGAELWVAAGTYFPTTSTTDREASFDLKSGVAVYGGFAGTESSREQRNPASNRVLLSGDIDHDDPTDSNGIVIAAQDANDAFFGKNSYHVVTAHGVRDNAILDGFTITGGQANGTNTSELNTCGAVPGDSEANSVLLRRACGGGIYVRMTSPFTGTGNELTLNNLVIAGNYATQGGGVFSGYLTTTRITNSTIFRNNTHTIGGGMLTAQTGFGGIPPVRVIDVGFVSNYSAGGLYGQTALGGAGMALLDSIAEVTNCTFTENIGHAVASFKSAPRLVNCTMSGNLVGFYAYGRGSAAGYIGVVFPELTNCTITNNDNGIIHTATFGNSGYHARNTIIWGNDLDIVDTEEGDAATFQHCVMPASGCSVPGYTCANIISADPRLGPLQNNGGPTQTYALLPGSSAIDQGWNFGLTTDQRRLPRPVDDPSIPNVSGGNGTDIGAFEVQTVLNCQPVTAALSGGGTIPPGGSTTLTVTLTGASAPYTVTLSNNGGTLIGASPLQFTVSPGATTTYTISSATDASGCPASVSGSATVNVFNDTTPPIISCPADVVAILDPQQCNATVNPGTATAIDNVTSTPTITGMRSDGQPLSAPYPKGITTITWRAVDAASNPATCMQTVTINCPTITLPALAGSALVGVFYDQALSASPSGNYSYSVSGTLPPGLTVNPATGRLSGISTQVGLFSFTVTAMACGCSGSRTYSLAIVCPSITLTPASLPSAVTGMAYSQLITANPTGTGYSYAVNSGTLPTGLSLNSVTGALSGTPLSAGNYSFAITTTGVGLCTGTRAYNLLVTSTCTTITVNPASLPQGTLGTLYSQTVSATGGVAPYSFSLASGALPGGLTLDTNSGFISGIPAASGSFVFTIRATGQGGCTGQRSYVLSVSCGTLTFAPNTLPNGVRGSIYSHQLSVSPANHATFSVLLGSLPPGFTLSSAGLLSGTTSQTGTYNFMVKAVAGTCQSTKTYSLVISASLTAFASSGDYDGDGKSDAALWTASNGVWRIVRSSDGQTANQSWGMAGDVTLLGDYDGDGKSDLAVFRPREATFYVKRSSDGRALIKQWGLSTDVPVPGDYDGDGKTDIAVWRGSNGTWYIVRSSDGQYNVQAWGAGYAPYHDMPVVGDYDGDGKSDVAVFRRATGTWLIKRSGDGESIVKQWGTATDTLVAADYDGDGRTDMAVWRPTNGTWYVWQSATGDARMMLWGMTGDQPVLGDYDGDGKADATVWRAGDNTWYVKHSGNNKELTQTSGPVGAQPVGGH
jgi:hypothetical protein